MNDQHEPHQCGEPESLENTKHNDIKVAEDADEGEVVKRGGTEQVQTFMEIPLVLQVRVLIIISPLAIAIKGDREYKHHQEYRANYDRQYVSLPS